MITLLVRQGNQPEVELNVSGDTASIGRAPGNQVHLTQNYVSKKHLRVLKGVVIVDLGSANGTFLDGKRLKDPQLYTGGELRIGDGDVYIRVRLDEREVQADNATLIAVPPSGIIRRADLPEPKADRGESEKLTALLAEARRRIRELETELEASRGAPSALPTGPSPADLEARAELESVRGELESTCAELESSRAELERLREQVAALQAQEAKPQVPQSPAAELFLRLQSENSTLKRRLAELQSKPGASAPGPAPDASSARLLAEIVELRAQNAALRSRTAPPPARESSNVRGLFARLAKEDVDRQAPLLAGSVEEFLVLEQFRLARTVERIVTRIAGDAIELIDGRTCLPQLQSSAGVTGAANLRQLIARLCESAENAEARNELLQYCAQLSRWLVASLGAERKAATSFTHQLKTDLTEQGLTSRAPIPALKRLAGQSDAELWRRASVYLRELTPDMIQDRLEKLTRAAVIEFVTEESSPGAAPSAS